MVPFDVRYGFLLVCYSSFVPKTDFQIFRFKLQKCRDLEIRVRGLSRSLKVVPFKIGHGFPLLFNGNFVRKITFLRYSPSKNTDLETGVIDH